MGKRHFVCLLALSFQGLSSPAVAREDENRKLGDSRVIAHLPAQPGYPEGIAVVGNRMFVSTDAHFGIDPGADPEVEAFDIRTGALVDRYPIPDRDPNQEHGLSGIAADEDGFLYVIDTQWGIVRINPRNGAQHIYASAPPSFLLPCALVKKGECSPNPGPGPSLPNDLVFDHAGYLYITDSLQATIWVVAPGGGAPTVFYQDPRLGGGFGANGIRLDRARRHFYINVTVDPFGRGVVYRLPVDLSSGLEQFHDYGFAAGPDDLAFGKSGQLYVSLAFSHQISVLDASGAEVARYSGPARDKPNPVPWDMPSGIAFDDHTESLLVNNHAEFSGIASHFVVFDVFVDDKASPLVKPEPR